MVGSGSLHCRACGSPSGTRNYCRQYCRVKYLREKKRQFTLDARAKALEYCRVFDAVRDSGKSLEEAARIARAEVYGDGNRAQGTTVSSCHNTVTLLMPRRLLR